MIGITLSCRAYLLNLRGEEDCWMALAGFDDEFKDLPDYILKITKRIWEDRTATPRNRWSNIHMVRNGENIWMLNESGELIIAKL